jgi:hypothetical protein
MLSKKHTIYILVRCLTSSQKSFCSRVTVDLPETSIPTIGSTVGSPLVYGYRTKLTPHFERPPKSVREQKLSSDEQPSWLRIGFNMTNRATTMDIEVGSIFIHFTLNTEPSSWSFLIGMSDSCSNYK